MTEHPVSADCTASVEAECKLWPEPYRPWATDFHLGLVLQGLDSQQIAEELRIQRELVNDSGEDPADLFGDATQYAEHRADIVYQHSASPEVKQVFGNLRGFTVLIILVLSALLLILSFVAGSSRGWLSQDIPLAALVALPGVGIMFFGIYRGCGNFSQGFRGKAIVTWTLVLCIMAALYFADLVPALAGTAPVPNLAVAVVALLTGVVLIRLLLSRPKHQESAAGIEVSEWLEIVGRTLRGRYLYTSGEVRSAVASAREHLEQDGGPMSPTQLQLEFGDPKVFALALASTSRVSAQRTVVLWDVPWLVLTAILGVDVYHDAIAQLWGAWQWFQILGMLLLAANLIVRWWPSQRRAAADEVLNRRRRQLKRVGASR